MCVSNQLVEMCMNVYKCFYVCELECYGYEICLKVVYMHPCVVLRQVKKVKKTSKSEKYDGTNPFQKLQNRKNEEVSVATSIGSAA